MISFEEMQKAEKQRVKIQLDDGRIVIGYCPYVVPKEPGEDEENAMFFDQGENKYYIEQPEIKSIEIIK